MIRNLQKIRHLKVNKISAITGIPVKNLVSADSTFKRIVLTAKIEIFQKSIKTLIDSSKVVINVFKHHK